MERSATGVELRWLRRVIGIDLVRIFETYLSVLYAKKHRVLTINDRVALLRAIIAHFFLANAGSIWPEEFRTLPAKILTRYIGAVNDVKRQDPSLARLGTYYLRPGHGPNFSDEPVIPRRRGRPKAAQGAVLRSPTRETGAPDTGCPEQQGISGGGSDAAPPDIPEPKKGRRANGRRSGKAK